MDYIDNAYIRRAGLHLERFKDKGQNQFNFRCPVCGDSHKSKSKARGWIYENKGKAWAHCFNCSYAQPFDKFLKQFFPNIYSEYRIEKFGKKSEDKPSYTFKKPIFEKKFKEDLSIPSLDTLDDDHPAVLYVRSRQIPEDKFNLLFHTNGFKAFINTIVPNKFPDTKKDDARLIIPFYSMDGELTYIQGRSYEADTEMRYITIRILEVDKLYGLERIDVEDDIIVVEGPIDSLFIDNALAMAGSSISHIEGLPKDKIIFAFDREPRNKEIIQMMERYVDRGYRVAVLPPIVEGKDINEWVINGVDPVEIREDIINNSYSGLKCKMMINEWRKI
jgi:hypothetical protein